MISEKQYRMDVNMALLLLAKITFNQEIGECSDPRMLNELIRMISALEKGLLKNKEKEKK